MDGPRSHHPIEPGGKHSDGFLGPYLSCPCFAAPTRGPLARAGAGKRAESVEPTPVVSLRAGRRPGALAAHPLKELPQRLRMSKVAELAGELAGDYVGCLVKQALPKGFSATIASPAARSLGRRALSGLWRWTKNPGFTGELLGGKQAPFGSGLIDLFWPTLLGLGGGISIGRATRSPPPWHPDAGLPMPQMKPPEPPPAIMPRMPPPGWPDPRGPQTF